MKIVVAPDSFKGSLSAKEVGDNIEIGIKRVLPLAEIVKVPMADGGEGTVESLIDGSGGQIINISVKDPLMRDIDSFYGILGDGKTAIIEMATASGLPLLDPKERNPLNTSTYGTGELVLDAINRGCKRIIIGLGGSATNDGGVGFLSALGIKFKDSMGNEIKPVGGELDKLSQIDISSMDERIKSTQFIAACDVDNPLVGERGASAIFGPQKGADEKMVSILDANLNHYGDVIFATLGIDIKQEKGAGAAGGLGGGILAFLNVELKGGIDIVIDITGLEDKIKGADLIITGEGMMDYQTKFGKTPYGVCILGNKNNIPVVAIAGGLGREYKSLYELGFKSIFSIVDKPMSLENAIKDSKILVQDVAERIVRLICI